MLLVARLFLACDTSVVLLLSKDRDIDTDYLDMCIVNNGEFDELKSISKPQSNRDPSDKRCNVTRSSSVETLQGNNPFMCDEQHENCVTTFENANTLNWRANRDHSKKPSTNPKNRFNKKQYKYDNDADIVKLFCHKNVYCDTGEQKVDEAVK